MRFVRMGLFDLWLSDDAQLRIWVKLRHTEFRHFPYLADTPAVPLGAFR